MSIDNDYLSGLHLRLHILTLKIRLNDTNVTSELKVDECFIILLRFE